MHPNAAMVWKILSVALMRQGKDAFQALRLRDYARVDLRVNAREEIFVLEVNPNSYLEQTAEFAAAAAKDGTDYNTLISRIVELASARYSR